MPSSWRRWERKPSYSLKQLVGCWATPHAAKLLPCTCCCNEPSTDCIHLCTPPHFLVHLYLSEAAEDLENNRNRRLPSRNQGTSLIRALHCRHLGTQQFWCPSIIPHDVSFRLSTQKLRGKVQGRNKSLENKDTGSFVLVFYFTASHARWRCSFESPPLEDWIPQLGQGGRRG